MEVAMNAGKKWTKEEEAYLLQELKNNISMEQIAGTHGRTVKGIRLRIEDLAYQMYLAKTPVSEIMTRTKLTKEQLKQAFQRIQTQPPNKTTEVVLELTEIREELAELQEEIQELKGLLIEINKKISVPVPVPSSARPLGRVPHQT